MHNYDEFRKEMRVRGRRMYYRYQYQRYAEVVGSAVGWLLVLGLLLAVAIVL